MRLLNARSLELVDVSDDAVPPYAILSHTWGNEEITIQQLRRLKGWSQMKGLSLKSLDKNKRAIAAKNGFLKIENAAQLAVSRGLSYIWIDTCCIDKTSSAELSEAINSMYLWYKRSAECYAFLADVDPGVGNDSESIYGSLHDSRWFTRGWTLQELVAPKSVLFYARDWTLLGRKDSPAAFTKAIAEITRIDEEVLDGRIDPLQLSVSARMAWASYRSTTRLEDTAYCLMGLFQVNMPLLYGEGSRAFTRLQEEIIQHTDDQSLFAWNSFDDTEDDPDALFGMLAHSPAQFRDSGKLQPLPPLPIYASAPSSITNQGLRVQLYLRPVSYNQDDSMEEDYYAILDCVMRLNDTYQCPVILLRRLSEDQYGRLQTSSQQFVPPPLSHYIPEYEGYRSVYIRQQPVYYHLPQFRLSPLHMESGIATSNGLQYRLLDTFPSQQWNSTTMTLKVDYSRKLRAMGIFRFQSVSETKEQVDVVVGLRRLNTMEWEGWCFQLSERKSSLENVFHQINEGIERITVNSINQITSRTLRDSLGDDSSLVSNATVEGIQLQGRLYISVLVTPTAEIHTTRELSERPEIFNMIWSSGGNFRPLPNESLVQIVTEVCSWSSTTEIASPSPWDSQPVRVTWPAGDAMDTARGNFMKPLYDFMSRLKGTRSQGGEISPTEAFSEALFDGDVAKVEEMLAKQPDLEAYTSDLHGFLPLHWAVAGGSRDCVKLLLTNRAARCRLTKNGLAAGHVAALCNTRVWNALSTSSGFTNGPLQLAALRTDHHSDTALHVAAACSPDSDYGRTFFQDAMSWCSDHIGLLPRNAYDETPLHRAAANNNAIVIRALVGRIYSFNANVVDRHGRTALWHGAATGSCDAITALLEFGASINLPDDLGRTPLHAACRGGHDKAVQLLLQRGAAVQTETHSLDLTPMDFAAIFGHHQCLNHLLDIRYDLPSLERANKALHMAASCGSFECVDVLCHFGANPFVEMSQYMRVSVGCAELVNQKGTARNVAELELHGDIVTYFNSSETCRRHRLVHNIEVDALDFSQAPDNRASLGPPLPGPPLPGSIPVPVFTPVPGSETPNYHMSYDSFQNAPTPLYGPPPPQQPQQQQQPPPQKPSFTDYFSAGRRQSANLPARVSSTNAYAPAPPNAPYPMYEPSKAQGSAPYGRPATYGVSSEMVPKVSKVAMAPQQSTSIAVRASSTPAQQQHPSQSASVPVMAPASPYYQRPSTQSVEMTAPQRPPPTPYPANPYR